MTPNLNQEPHDELALKETLAETYKSLVTLAVEAFRYLVLINGGAIVALLAYLGNVAKNGDSAPNLGTPLLLFTVGLVACGVAMAFAYRTQLHIFNDLFLSGKFSTRHKLTLWVAVSSYVISLFSFSCAAWLAIQAFQCTQSCG